MGLGQAKQHCTFCVHISSCLYLTAQLTGATLSFKVAFTISSPVNGGMSDWFIRAQILK
jgi:hypothetical protein